MSKIAISSISLIVGIIIGIFLFKECLRKIPIQNPTHTETTYTVYIKGDSVITELHINHPYPVYVYKTPTVITSLSICDSTRFYSDTTRIDSVSYFIAQDTVIGKKTASFRKYIGVPYFKQITITIKDSIPFEVKSFKNGLYLSGGIAQDGVIIGADFVSKQKWAIGYNYNPITKINSASFKYQLFGNK